MIWSALFGLLGATVLSGAMLGAALGLTGFAILHFFGGGATRLGVQAVFNVLGEFTLTALLVAGLQERGVRCLAATTRREVVDLGGGRRETVFRFVRFREYPPLARSGPR